MNKTVPVFWGEPGDPERRLIGSASVDPNTCEVEVTLDDRQSGLRRRLGGPSISFSIHDALPSHTRLAPDAIIRTISAEPSEAELNARIDRLHGPGASAALDAALKDGSIFNDG